MSGTEIITPQQDEQVESGQSKRIAGSLAVTVLMGGPSSEREISLKSGKAVAQALEHMGHDVVQADIGPDDLAALDRGKLDVVFPALHGTFGEDGAIQEIMEQRGIKYCGAGPTASRLAMDKMESKWRFLQAGIPVADGGIIDRSDKKELHSRLLDRLGLPVVVKPVDQGSSLDVIIATDEKIRETAIEKLVEKYSRCMLERFIAGREITVGVLGEKALPIIDIVTPGGFFDFANKYESATTEYRLDIDLPKEVYRQVQRAARQAHCVLGCRDFSRVDLRLDAKGRPAVLEVNTIPGLTSRSLLPMAAQKAGISFEQLCDQLIRMAYGR
ncbi:MAG: D-alanine--D-alanine ligase [Actinobacteria bacterium]|nr:D-alanine--D-alanine ligase [Actinomycetota bacterium]